MRFIPSTVLCKNGSFASIEIPRKLEHFNHWTHPQYFPQGIFPECSSSVVIDGDFYTATLFASNTSNEKQYQDANLHELPTTLDTKLFFGHLLFVINRDGLAFSCKDGMFHALFKYLDGKNDMHTTTSYSHNTSQSCGTSYSFTTEFEEEEDMDWSEDSHHNESRGNFRYQNRNRNRHQRMSAEFEDSGDFGSFSFGNDETFDQAEY